MWIGQSSKDLALSEEKLAWEGISGRRREVDYVQSLAMVETQTVLLVSLYTKLSVMKNVIKFMYRTGSAFKYLAAKFPGEAEIKEGSFVGPQISQIASQRWDVWQPASGRQETSLGFISSGVN